MANPMLIKAAIQILASPQSRKMIISVVTGLLTIILIVTFSFTSILSGLFALFVNDNNQNEWARIMAHLEDTFFGYRSEY